MHTDLLFINSRRRTLNILNGSLEHKLLKTVNSLHKQPCAADSCTLRENTNGEVSAPAPMNISCLKKYF